MQRDLNIFGVYLPPLLACLMIAWLLTWLLSRFLIRVDFYQFVWQRPLFDLGLYTVILGGTLLAFAAARGALGA